MANKPHWTIYPNKGPGKPWELRFKYPDPVTGKIREKTRRCATEEEAKQVAFQIEEEMGFTTAALIKPETDIRLHRGNRMGVRLVQTKDGSSVWMPEHLIIQVAVDATEETRNALIRSHTEKDEVTGETWLYQHRGDRSFETGRQVYIEIETTEKGDWLILSVTIKHLDRPIRSRDVNEYLPIETWAEEGLRRATGELSSPIEPGPISDETWKPGLLLADQLLSEVRKRPAAPMGRTVHPEGLKLALKLYHDNKNYKEITKAIKEQLGIVRSERTIRRWIENMIESGTISDE